MNVSEELSALMDAAHDARVAGHTETEIARAAMIELPAPVDVERVVAVLVERSGVTHPEDVDCIREYVVEILDLAGVRATTA